MFETDHHQLQSSRCLAVKISRCWSGGFPSLFLIKNGHIAPKTLGRDDNDDEHDWRNDDCKADDEDDGHDDDNDNDNDNVDNVVDDDDNDNEASSTPPLRCASRHAVSLYSADSPVALSRSGDHVMIMILDFGLLDLFFILKHENWSGSRVRPCFIRF